MEITGIWLSVVVLVLLLLPYINAWDRKRVYGNVETGQQDFKNKFTAEVSTRSKMILNRSSARSRSSSPTTDKSIGIYHYNQALLVTQYVPFILCIGLAMSTPFILNLISPVMMTGLEAVISMGLLWLLIAVLFLIVLIKSRKAFCQIDKDGLLFSHWSIHDSKLDPELLFIPAKTVQWMGPYQLEAEPKIKAALIPVTNFVPFPYFPIALPKWGIIYCDELYQYALYFYPNQDLVSALKHNFPRQCSCEIASVLKKSKLLKGIPPGKTSQETNQPKQVQFKELNNKDEQMSVPCSMSICNHLQPILHYEFNRGNAIERVDEEKWTSARFVVMMKNELDVQYFSTKLRLPVYIHYREINDTHNDFGKGYYCKICKHFIVGS